MKPRKPSPGTDPAAGFEDYREEREAANLESKVETQYNDVVAAAPEKLRNWIRAVALAIESGEAAARNRTALVDFFRRVRYHMQKGQGAVLAAAMSLLDGRDYEKWHWEDDSGCLFAALEYFDRDIVALITMALADGGERARDTAVKWLPKYTADVFATPILAGLLADEQREVRWWAAIHLSRLAPSTPGLTPTLVEALRGEWIPSARLIWLFGLRGRGEAAAALARLGARAQEAIPDLLRAIRPSDGISLGYNERWIGRAMRAIAGDREALRLLAPLRKENFGCAAAADEIENPRGTLECFVAYFCPPKAH